MAKDKACWSLAVAVASADVALIVAVVVALICFGQHWPAPQASVRHRASRQGFPCIINVVF